MPQKAVFQTSLTDTWATPTGGDRKKGDQPGDIRWENNKCYKCVIFDNGTGSVAAVVGKACYYVAATGHNEHTVTMDVTDSGGLGAGIFLSIPADAERCWIQIKGPATGVSGLLNAAANDGLAITAVDAAADGELTVCNADSEPIVGSVVDESLFIINCDFPF